MKDEMRKPYGNKKEAAHAASNIYHGIIKSDQVSTKGTQLF